MFTADALAAYLDARERAAAPATVKKERAALVRLAKYLHARRLVDAIELLLVPSARTRGATTREALDAATWARVVDVARARLTAGPRRRTSPIVAARDLALVLLLGGAGPRSEEARRLSVDAVRVRRSDATRPWLRVVGKGPKTRECRSVPSSPTPCWAGSAPAPRSPSSPATRCCFPPSAAGAATARFRRRRDRAAVGPAADEHRQADHARRRRPRADSRTRTCCATPPRPCFLTRSPHRLLELRDLLGHASSATTSVYLHTAHASLQAAIDEQARRRCVLEAHAERRAPSRPRL